MNEDASDYDPNTNPFLLILDAHIHGQISDDERHQLLTWAYPNIEDKTPEYVRPTGRNAAQQWMAIAQRRIADELDAFLDQAAGDTVSVAAIRAFASRLRRNA